MVRFTRDAMPYRRGETADFPETTGRRLLDAGVARQVDGPSPLAGAKAERQPPPGRGGRFPDLTAFEDGSGAVIK